MRILLYCVTRVGIGHFVRTREIARALSERHQTFLVDGTVPVPDRSIHSGIQRIILPNVYRQGNQILAGEKGRSLEDVTQLRIKTLTDAIERIRPHALIIEHFPFSKQEHQPEVISMIQAAKIYTPSVKVIGSIRDLSPLPNYRATEDDYRQRTLSLLHQYFDLLLVHSDPSIVKLRDSLPWANAIKIPVQYTGYVVEPLTVAESHFTDNTERLTTKPIIVSGGGRHDASLYNNCIHAWQLLQTHEQTFDRHLQLYMPAGQQPVDVLDPDLAANTDNVRVSNFAPSLVDQLANADLSISLAGYNTCTNILVSGVRSILSPSDASADQVYRAKIMERLGLCTVVPEQMLTPERLADAIKKQLKSMPVCHSIDLRGAEKVREILEQCL